MVSKKIKQKGKGRVTVTVSGDNKIKSLDEVRALISDGYSRYPSYTDAIMWLIKMFDQDKINMSISPCE